MPDSGKILEQDDSSLRSGCRGRPPLNRTCHGDQAGAQPRGMKMIRNSFYALAASLTTLSVFAGTLAVLAGGTGAGIV